MKINELRALIREMIQTEVSQEVNKVMGKLLIDLIKESKSTNKKRKNHVEPEEEDEMEEIEEVQNNVPILKTNNAKLNSVLAETARNFKPLPKQGQSLVDLMDGGFTNIGENETTGVTEPKNNMDFIRQMVNESASPAPLQNSVLDTNLPAEVKNLFKKDFGAILKRSQEKSLGR